ncbi:hypothetical protein AB8O38_06110 [Saccharomonospora xinjiangensis]|uniref:hypothetical protein n=1 Tax=Saccharomonospora xinjiangensis TaxID=75294 RepID=UPI00350ED932
MAESAFNDRSGVSPWRPYDDDPLFSEAFLQGWGAVDATQAERVQLYLAELLAARPFPIAVPVAFNAIYFGYDLDFGGYVGGPLELDEFPPVVMGETSPALPLGAMVKVAAGGGDLYAEVVYKEGCHPDAQSGGVPAWLAGAPAAVGETFNAELFERLICDFGAFGQGVSAKRMAKLRSQQRWMDHRGHLVVRSLYADAETAELDDIAHYARYLSTAARELLLSPAAPQPLLFMLDDPDAADLERLIALALQTTRAALASIPGVRMWGAYATTEDSLQRRKASDEALGGADLRAVAAGLSRPPQDRKRLRTASRTVTYTALGPRLTEFSGAEERLVSVNYPEAICHANLVVGDYLAAEVVDGVLPGGNHVRLDDRWQSGGMWRNEFPAGPHSRIAPTEPLGLGWWESQNQVSEGSAEAQDEEHGANGYLTVISDDRGDIMWTIALRSHHLASGICPLPTVLTAALRTDTSVTFRITHPGTKLEVDEATQRVSVVLDGETPALRGIVWPRQFTAGIVVTFTWTRNGSVVRACTTELHTPKHIDGWLITHVHDPRVVTRDWAPGEPKPGRAAGTATLSLRDRIMRVVRRLGLLFPDGSVVFDESRLSVAVYGSRALGNAAALLDPSVASLVAEGTLRRDVATRSLGWLRYPPLLGHDTTVRVLIWHPTSRMGGEDDNPTSHGLSRPREHKVGPFLRRISGQPSEAARIRYRELVAHYGLATSPELPEGYTLVKRHTRAARKGAVN